MTVRHTVLIVEDQGLNAMFLRAVVEACGHSVCAAAATAADAIALAEEHRPTVVVVDLELAGERDGLEAARDIRAAYETSLIFCTAYNDEKSMAKMEALQPVAVLGKPVNSNQLKAALEACPEAAPCI